MTSPKVDSLIIERRTAEIAAALDRVRDTVATAARRAGRDPAAVRIIGVTKGFGPETPCAAIAAGLAELGENRIQEARDKIPQVEAHAPQRVTWHLVGHLQTNKAKLAAELFDWVESVDSLRVAVALSQRRARGPLRVLLQVRTSSEPTKTGFSPDELVDVASEIAALPNLDVRGLMTVAPLDPDLDVARRAFHALRSLSERLAALGDPACRMEHLSMGMSGDYEVAIEEGATIVRLGTALFGPRR